MPGSLDKRYPYRKAGIKLVSLEPIERIESTVIYQTQDFIGYLRQIAKLRGAKFMDPETGNRAKII